VPPDFVRLCETLVLHRDPARFALMYRLLWRMTEQPDLRHDPLDADRLQAHRMARAVARDMHKMHAFVRFRPVVDGTGQTLHIAWFEPDHFITEATAGFFVRRFTQMHWAILTPEASVRWDGAQLHTGPGAQRSDAPPPDAGEALWLTYYRSIFNPARLKLAMMKKEMPTRYWHNLPEAALISELAHGAHERSARMVEAPATAPRRRGGRAATPGGEAADNGGPAAGR
jgi:DNA polymerase